MDIDTHELTDADRFVVQATHGLWDAAHSLKRVNGSDLQQHELNSLISDVDDVVEQLKRLQLEIMEGILTDLQAELQVTMTELAPEAIPF